MTCISHCLDLFLEDIASEKVHARDTDEGRKMKVRFSWLSDVVSEGMEITVFLQRHEKFRVALSEKSNLKLRKGSETRFGYHYYALERFVENRSPLREIFAGNKFDELRKSLSTSELKTKFDQMKVKILDDKFWSKLADSLAVMKPAVVFLRQSDDSKFSAASVYPGFIKTMEKIDAVGLTEFLTLQRREEVVQRLEERWNYCDQPIYSVAQLLQPFSHPLVKKPAEQRELEERKKKGEDVDEEDEQKRREEEDSALRTNFNLIVEREYSSEQDQNAASLELTAWEEEKFEGRARSALEKLDMRAWWSQFGHKFPKLKHLAKLISSACATSGNSERAFKAMRDFQLQRSSLQSKTLDKQVYVYYHRIHKKLTRVETDIIT